MAENKKISSFKKFSDIKKSKISSYMKNKELKIKEKKIKELKNTKETVKRMSRKIIFI